MLAMHAPDGFLEPSVALAMAVISAVILAYTFRVNQRSFSERQIPLAGLAAAFVFATQMFNFPVAAGTSGHLLGAALVAILLGPAMGSLVVAAVVIVQALLFADGGITALGYNVFNMAIVPAYAGWTLYWLVRQLMPRTSSGVVAASGIASGLSIVLAAMAFAVEWLFGASAPVPFDTVFGAMVVVHLLIGIGEGVISALVVGAVLAARPDLVVGARDLTPDQLQQKPRVGVRTFVVSGALVTAAVAMVLSQFSASTPDGLQRVASDQGFAAAARPHLFADGAFADYATRGLTNPTASLAVAGLVGVTVLGLVGYGLAAASRRFGRTV